MASGDSGGDHWSPEDEFRLVQHWMWFSLNGSFWPQGTEKDQRGFNGSLYDYRTQELMPFGQTFVAFQNQGHTALIPLVRQ